MALYLKGWPPNRAGSLLSIWLMLVSVTHAGSQRLGDRCPCWETSFILSTESRSNGQPEPQGENSTPRHTTLLNIYPQQTWSTLRILVSKTRNKSDAETNFCGKHLIVLMQMSLLNSAAPWFCPCCSDIVFLWICSVLLIWFNFRLCVWNNAILGMDGMLGWAWVTFGTVLVFRWLPKRMEAHLYMSLMS